jgi:hypothetical protein
MKKTFRVCQLKESYTSRNITNSKSINLMPMNGTINPPTP